MRVVCGHLKESSELDTVASGGFATALARKMVSRGGVVLGVAYTKDFKGAEYVKVENLSDIELIKGTKYIRAAKRLASGRVLRDEIKECLISGKLVLCFGLPCEIASIYHYLQTNNVNVENYYSVDLVCHGPAINEIHKSFIEMLESRYNSHIVNYTTRYKNPEWKPAFIRAEFENGEIYVKKLNDSEFGKAFNICPQKCSYSCRFKGSNRCSDITMGDYWGITENEIAYNSKGVSVGFVHNDRCNWLLDIDDYSLYEADIETALSGNPRYLLPLRRNPDSERFLKLYKMKGLEYACQHYMGIQSRLKRIVKLITRRQ